MSKIEGILGELAGEASLCWNPGPKGVFDSTQASVAVNRAKSKLGKIILVEDLPSVAEMARKLGRIVFEKETGAVIMPYSQCKRIAQAIHKLMMSKPEVKG